jgi:hypothetical protein
MSEFIARSKFVKAVTNFYTSIHQMSLSRNMFESSPQAHDKTAAVIGLDYRDQFMRKVGIMPQFA